MNSLSVRPLSEAHIPLITQYWLGSDPAFLQGMGVDLDKMPGQSEWEKSLLEQLSQPIPDKKSYCIIWQVDDQAVGHSNINKIQLGEEAYMHLHLWRTNLRQKGMGTDFVKLTLPHFFENYHLKTLYCEPYSLNPAPNKTLEKVGFQFVKEYVTTPGWLNFEQPVNLWELSRERFLSLP
ncbi:MAG: GNAT family N-acetyltransferase [Phycisphaerae bacterium]|nr:GNAT family N-acetyltransferase [Saprospiraceae bacterium]